MFEKDRATLLQQQAICKKYGLPEAEPEDMVGVAMATLGRMPVYGSRIALPAGGNVSWFFHCGEYSDAPDFYQPVHVEHLNEILPSVIKYLRLPTGAKFIIDDQGFEDVWLVQ
ncbi:immunity protein Imm33 domain-containing protein [Trinickia sp.]|uniref:immunity protein Imm33 domain-containing protein n=1 Tax=Trinickia sp. TaxID=2571163 RepID=UPI003F7F0E62